MKKKCIKGMLEALLELEREVFFLTGYQMPFLKAYWLERGKRTQAMLDKERALRDQAKYDEMITLAIKEARTLEAKRNNYYRVITKLS